MAPDYRPPDIDRALRQVGVTAASLVFTHSNLGFFGRLEGASTGDALAQHFLDAYRRVLGERGTLVVPTFSYSFCWGKPFDASATPSVCGLFSEHVRRRPEALRSRDPNFSVAAVGALARELTTDPPEHAFGKGCFWERFLDHGGVFVNFNFDAGSTFVHYVEKCLEVPYRNDKAFEGTFIDAGRESRGRAYHFVYDHERREHAPEFTRLHDEALRRGLLRTAKLGRGEAVAIEARAKHDLIVDMIRGCPGFLVQGHVDRRTSREAGALRAIAPSGPPTGPAAEEGPTHSDKAEN